MLDCESYHMHTDTMIVNRPRHYFISCLSASNEGCTFTRHALNDLRPVRNWQAKEHRMEQQPMNNWLRLEYTRGHSGVVVGLLAYHHGKPSSIPAGLPSSKPAANVLPYSVRILIDQWGSSFIHDNEARKQCVANNFPRDRPSSGTQVLVCDVVEAVWTRGRGRCVGSIELLRPATPRDPAGLRTTWSQARPAPRQHCSPLTHYSPQAILNLQFHRIPSPHANEALLSIENYNTRTSHCILQSMPRQSQCSRVLQALLRTVGFTRRFHTLSSIQATITSLTFVPQSPVVVYTSPISRALGQAVSVKDCWPLGCGSVSQSHQNILVSSPDSLKPPAGERDRDASMAPSTVTARRLLSIIHGFPRKGGHLTTPEEGRFEVVHRHSLDGAAVPGHSSQRKSSWLSRGLYDNGSYKSSPIQVLSTVVHSPQRKSSWLSRGLYDNGSYQSSPIQVLSTVVQSAQSKSSWLSRGLYDNDSYQSSPIQVLSTVVHSAQSKSSWLPRDLYDNGSYQSSPIQVLSTVVHSPQRKSSWLSRGLYDNGSYQSSPIQVLFTVVHSAQSKSSWLSRGLYDNGSYQSSPIQILSTVVHSAQSKSSWLSRGLYDNGSYQSSPIQVLSTVVHSAQSKSSWLSRGLYDNGSYQSSPIQVVFTVVQSAQRKSSWLSRGLYDNGSYQSSPIQVVSTVVHSPQRKSSWLSRGLYDNGSYQSSPIQVLSTVVHSAQSKSSWLSRGLYDNGSYQSSPIQVVSTVVHSAQSKSSWLSRGLYDNGSYQSSPIQVLSTVVHSAQSKSSWLSRGLYDNGSYQSSPIQVVFTVVHSAQRKSSWLSRGLYDNGSYHSSPIQVVSTVVHSPQRKSSWLSRGLYDNGSYQSSPIQVLSTVVHSAQSKSSWLSRGLYDNGSYQSSPIQVLSTFVHSAQSKSSCLSRGLYDNGSYQSSPIQVLFTVVHSAQSKSSWLSRGLYDNGSYQSSPIQILSTVVHSAQSKSSWLSRGLYDNGSYQSSPIQVVSTVVHSAQSKSSWLSRGLYDNGSYQSSPIQSSPIQVVFTVVHSAQRKSSWLSRGLYDNGSYQSSPIQVVSTVVHSAQSKSSWLSRVLFTVVHSDQSKSSWLSRGLYDNGSYQSSPIQVVSTVVHSAQSKSSWLSRGFQRGEKGQSNKAKLKRWEKKHCSGAHQVSHRTNCCLQSPNVSSLALVAPSTLLSPPCGVFVVVIDSDWSPPCSVGGVLRSETIVGQYNIVFLPIIETISMYGLVYSLSRGLTSMAIATFTSNFRMTKENFDALLRVMEKRSRKKTFKLLQTHSPKPPELADVLPIQLGYAFLLSSASLLRAVHDKNSKCFGNAGISGNAPLCTFTECQVCIGDTTPYMTPRMDCAVFCGGVVARQFVSHLGKPGSILGAESLPEFRMWESCRTMTLVGGVFSAISRFPSPFYSGAAPYSPRFTLNDSQDLDVRSRPNSITHSFQMNSSPSISTHVSATAVQSYASLAGVEAQLACGLYPAFSVRVLWRLCCRGGAVAELGTSQCMDCRAEMALVTATQDNGEKKKKGEGGGETKGIIITLQMKNGYGVHCNEDLTLNRIMRMRRKVYTKKSFHNFSVNQEHTIDTRVLLKMAHCLYSDVTNYNGSRARTACVDILELGHLAGATAAVNADRPVRKAARTFSWCDSSCQRRSQLGHLAGATAAVNADRPVRKAAGTFSWCDSSCQRRSS
ncbi:hypothetical protein PR048_007404 [Dryococelus australis]|uniref:Uncharacterized protein n=1 Tax=Dryococelus australis TaxID=614101 RepID=A0ABQ9HV30_9NEOP|nr:hypothetical protein PR048_007404 [Dryococelus australis]